MKVVRVYVDTSVLGGCFDEEFAPWSNGLMDDFRSGLYRPVLSEVTEREARRAPSSVRKLYSQLLAGGGEYLNAGLEVVALRTVYEQRQILTPKYRDDMLHIALATAANVAVLVSWSFKHMVHLDKIRLFNVVNLEFGYKQLSIRTPREVTSYESE